MNLAVQSLGLAPPPQKAKDDFSNVDAYAAQLGWYQLFSKKKGTESKHLGFNIAVGNPLLVTSDKVKCTRTSGDEATCNIMVGGW